MHYNADIRYHGHGNRVRGCRVHIIGLPVYA